MQIIIDSAERRSLALNMIKNIRAEDCPLECTIQPYIEGHSDKQQGMWHKMVREFARSTGYTEAELKEILKQEILGTIEVEFNGKKREITPSSQQGPDGNLTDKEFYSHLIDETYRIAAEMDVILE